MLRLRTQNDDTERRGSRPSPHAEGRVAAPLCRRYTQDRCQGECLLGAGDEVVVEAGAVGLVVGVGVVSLAEEDGHELGSGVEVGAGLADGFHAAVEFDGAGAHAVAEHAGVALLAEPGHGGGLDLGGQRAGRGGGVVEGVDLFAHRRVFVGDDPVGDLGVDEGHLEGAVTEQRGDGFEAHPAVDGLGGEGVAQAVGVHVVDPGDGADAGDDAVHGATIDRVVVVGEQPPAPADVLAVGGGPLGEEVDDFGVQGDHAVVAELADRDAEPVAVVADAGDGVGGELAELGGAQAGAGEDLGDEPVARERDGRGRRP